jgi:hypothetical protein
MNIEEIVRLPDPRKKVKLELREVVRELKKKPHVFVRARLSGWNFPERAPEPFMLIGDKLSKFVLIGEEGATADAYFDVKLSAAQRVSFGYGNTISWDFNVKADPERISRLDRSKLPKGVVELKKK